MEEVQWRCFSGAVIETSSVVEPFRKRWGLSERVGHGPLGAA